MIRTLNYMISLHKLYNNAAFRITMYSVHNKNKTRLFFFCMHQHCHLSTKTLNNYGVV